MLAWFKNVNDTDHRGFKYPHSNGAILARESASP